MKAAADVILGPCDGGTNDSEAAWAMTPDELLVEAAYTEVLGPVASEPPEPGDGLDDDLDAPLLDVEPATARVLSTDRLYAVWQEKAQSGAAALKMRQDAMRAAEEGDRLIRNCDEYSLVRLAGATRCLAFVSWVDAANRIGRIARVDDENKFVAFMYANDRPVKLQGCLIVLPCIGERARKLKANVGRPVVPAQVLELQRMWELADTAVITAAATATAAAATATATATAPATASAAASYVADADAADDADAANAAAQSQLKIVNSIADHQQYY